MRGIVGKTIPRHFVKQMNNMAYSMCVTQLAGNTHLMGACLQQAIIRLTT